MNAQAIINSSNLIANLAKALEYNEVTNGTSLMCHINSGDFALVSAAKVSARTAQGWVEAVSFETLAALGIVGETSDNGLIEAEKVAEWMRAQA